MSTHISTNHRLRAAVAWVDLPEEYRMGEGNRWIDEHVCNADDEPCQEVCANAPRFIRAYDQWWDVADATIASDELKAHGWDGMIVSSTNVGSSGLVLRHFDRDGYEYDDHAAVVGWVVSL